MIIISIQDLNNIIQYIIDDNNLSIKTEEELKEKEELLYKIITYIAVEYPFIINNFIPKIPFNLPESITSIKKNLEIVDIYEIIEYIIINYDAIQLDAKNIDDAIIIELITNNRNIHNADKLQEQKEKIENISEELNNILEYINDINNDLPNQHGDQKEIRSIMNIIEQYINSLYNINTTIDPTIEEKFNTVISAFANNFEIYIKPLYENTMKITIEKIKEFFLKKSQNENKQLTIITIYNIFNNIIEEYISLETKIKNEISNNKTLSIFQTKNNIIQETKFTKILEIIININQNNNIQGDTIAIKQTLKNIIQYINNNKNINDPKIEQEINDNIDDINKIEKKELSENIYDIEKDLNEFINYIYNIVLQEKEKTIEDIFDKEMQTNNKSSNTEGNKVIYQIITNYLNPLIENQEIEQKIEKKITNIETEIDKIKKLFNIMKKPLENENQIENLEKIQDLIYIMSNIGIIEYKTQEVLVEIIKNKIKQEELDNSYIMHNYTNDNDNEEIITILNEQEFYKLLEKEDKNYEQIQELNKFLGTIDKENIIHDNQEGGMLILNELLKRINKIDDINTLENIEQELYKIIKPETEKKEIKITQNNTKDQLLKNIQKIYIMITDIYKKNNIRINQLVSKIIKNANNIEIEKELDNIEEELCKILINESKIIYEIHIKNTLPKNIPELINPLIHNIINNEEINTIDLKKIENKLYSIMEDKIKKLQETKNTYSIMEDEINKQLQEIKLQETNFNTTYVTKNSFDNINEYLIKLIENEIKNKIILIKKKNKIYFFNHNQDLLDNILNIVERYLNKYIIHYNKNNESSIIISEYINKEYAEQKKIHDLNIINDILYAIIDNIPNTKLILKFFNILNKNKILQTICNQYKIDVLEYKSGFFIRYMENYLDRKQSIKDNNEFIQYYYYTFYYEVYYLFNIIFSKHETKNQHDEIFEKIFEELTYIKRIENIILHPENPNNYEILLSYIKKNSRLNSNNKQLIITQSFYKLQNQRIKQDNILNKFLYPICNEQKNTNNFFNLIINFLEQAFSLNDRLNNINSIYETYNNICIYNHKEKEEDIKIISDFLKKNIKEDLLTLWKSFFDVLKKIYNNNNTNNELESNNKNSILTTISFEKELTKNIKLSRSFYNFHNKERISNEIKQIIYSINTDYPEEEEEHYIHNNLLLILKTIKNNNDLIFFLKEINNSKIFRLICNTYFRKSNDKKILSFFKNRNDLDLWNLIFGKYFNNDFNNNINKYKVYFLYELIKWNINNKLEQYINLKTDNITSYTIEQYKEIIKKNFDYYQKIFFSSVYSILPNNEENISCQEREQYIKINNDLPDIIYNIINYQYIYTEKINKIMNIMNPQIKNSKHEIFLEEETQMQFNKTSKDNIDFKTQDCNIFDKIKSYIDNIIILQKDTEKNQIIIINFFHQLYSTQYIKYYTEKEFFDLIIYFIEKSFFLKKIYDNIENFIINTEKDLVIQKKNLNEELKNFISSNISKDLITTWFNSYNLLTNKSQDYDSFIKILIDKILLLNIYKNIELLPEKISNIINSDNDNWQKNINELLIDTINVEYFSMLQEDQIISIIEYFFYIMKITIFTKMNENQQTYQSQIPSKKFSTENIIKEFFNFFLKKLTLKIIKDNINNNNNNMKKQKYKIYSVYSEKITKKIIFNNDTLYNEDNKKNIQKKIINELYKIFINEKVIKQIPRINEDTLNNNLKKIIDNFININLNKLLERNRFYTEDIPIFLIEMYKKIISKQCPNEQKHNNFQISDYINSISKDISSFMEKIFKYFSDKDEIQETIIYLLYQLRTQTIPYIAQDHILYDMNFFYWLIIRTNLFNNYSFNTAVFNIIFKLLDSYMNNLSLKINEKDKDTLLNEILHSRITEEIKEIFSTAPLNKENPSYDTNIFTTKERECYISNNNILSILKQSLREKNP